jgi:tyrosinase
MMQRSQMNPNDPTGLLFQANIHATESGEMASNGGCPMGDPGQPLWDQCQHYSYFFLPWHRMYLYYFEKILRAASGDPNLALPYWNYELASEQTLPTAFLSPAVDCNGDPAANPSCNPLFLTNRCMNIIGNGFPVPPTSSGCPVVAPGSTPVTPALPPGDSDDSQAMADTSFEGSAGYFGGGTPPGSPPGACHFDSNQGDLESQPHDQIHEAVGGSMGDPGTAAQDPIFWLHHAEIDHLWKSWFTLCGGRQNPTDAAWLNTTFSFYDVDTQATVTLSAKQVLDTAAQLNYRYDDDPVGPQPCPPTGVTVRVEQEARRTPVPRVVLSSTRLELTGETTRIRTRLSADALTNFHRLLQAQTPQTPVLLKLEVTDVKNSGGVIYEVYLNLPITEAPTRSSRYFVGSLGLFVPRGKATTTLVFRATRALQASKERAFRMQESMSVTLVPRGLVNAETHEPLPIRPGVRASVLSASLETRGY